MNTLKQILLILMVLLTGYSCKEQDMMFREYTVDGGLTYPGKAKDVEVYAGKGRVKICWTNIDPTITSAIIFWNNYQDTLWVNFSKGTELVEQIINLPEGQYSFVIVTFDDHGNFSIPVEAFGRSYGTLYEQALVNRSPLKSEYTDDEKVVIDWGDTREGEIGVQIEYTDLGGQKQTEFIESTKTQITISGVNVSERLYYTTVYKPNPAAMDRFYAQTASLKVRSAADWLNMTDMSSLLENNEMPFRGENENSFGYLQAIGWDANEAGAANGNVDKRYGGGVLCFWVYMFGYSPIPEIWNGQIYQTIELEAGAYQLNAIVHSFYSESATNFKVYVAAALDELPHIDNVESASLGWASIPHNPAANSVYSAKFSLSQKSTVSLGFVANVVHSQQIFFKKVELWGNLD